MNGLLHLTSARDHLGSILGEERGLTFPEQRLVRQVTKGGQDTQATQDTKVSQVPRYTIKKEAVHYGNHI